MRPVDRRHLRRMLYVIDDARAKKISLVNAADNLLSLSRLLEHIDTQWSRDFASHLVTLDSAGTASANQQQEMGVRFSQLIEETLTALEALVKKAGGSLAPLEEE